MKKMLLTIITSFVCLINISANNSGSISGENYGQNVSGPGGSSGTFGGTYMTYDDAIRFRVFNNAGKNKNIDVYYSLDTYDTDCISSFSNFVLYQTSGYDFAKVSDIKVTPTDVNKLNFKCLKLDMNDVWSNSHANGATFKNLIEKNDYEILKNILDDNNYTFNDGDYIIIEPAARVVCDNKNYFGTANAFKGGNVSYTKQLQSYVSNPCKDTGSYAGAVFNNLFDYMATALNSKENNDCEENYFSYNATYSGCGFNKYYITTDWYTPPPPTTTTNTTCLEKAKATVGNPLARIALYEMYKAQNKKYLGLLNFNDTKNACSPIDEKQNEEVSCLYSRIYEDSFSSNNISKFIDIDSSIPSYKGYCNYEYDLENDLKTSNFGSTISGRILLGEDDSKLASVKSVKTCYFYFNKKEEMDAFKKINIGSDNSNDSIKIGNVYLDGTKLNFIGSQPLVKTSSQEITIKANNQNSCENYAMKTCQSGANSIGYSACYYSVINNCEQYGYHTTLENDYKQYIVEVKIENSGIYELPNVFLKKGSGEICNSIENSNCIDIGKVFLTKLNDKGLKNIEFENKIGDNKVLRANCKYTANPELIEDSNLKLEFRTISKSNPFTGKNGSGRNTGSNWCNGTDCSSTNETVKNVILDRNDSYDSTGDGPIYRIELKPYDIKLIRKKYSDKKYDEFYLDCDMNATNCKSLLLQEFNIKRLK